MFKLEFKGGNSYLFVNGTEIIKFKARDSKIVALAYPLCLGKISKDFYLDNIEKTGLNGYVYEKAWYKIMFEFIKKMFNVQCLFLGVMHLIQFHWIQFHYSIKVNKCSGSCNNICNNN